MNWLRDNMGLFKDVQKDTECLAQEVFNTGDVYFVPAFKGLYAPYWRKDARGCVNTPRNIHTDNLITKIYRFSSS